VEWVTNAAPNCRATYLPIRCHPEAAMPVELQSERLLVSGNICNVSNIDQ